MNMIKSFFHFLGSIQLAIALIAIAAITVIAGTLLESKTGSHLLAARWTYENPLFILLLSLFFINILFSALRRWPFKKKHIPFLMTHLGLLMMISGTMIKNRWGLQGQLTVWEGSGNQHLLLPHTYALLIEDKEKSMHPHSLIALDSFRPDIYYPFHFPQLKCKVIGYAPHVKEKLETWIKGSQAYIAGFPSIPVHDWEPTQIFPIAGAYRFALATNFPTWSILALRTSHAEEALRNAYLQGLTLRLRSKEALAESLEIPLQQALQHSFAFAGGMWNTTLDLSLLFWDEQTPPFLNFRWKSQDEGRKEEFTVPLRGQDALLVKPSSTNWAEPLFTVDLIRSSPFLYLIEDEQGNTFFYTFDSYGRLHSENFSSSQLQTLISYEKGFSGYGVQVEIPIPSFPVGREDKEKAEAHELTLQLRQALAQQPPLAPPLQFFQQACEKARVDFPDTFVQFLTEWNAHSTFVYHPSRMISEDVQGVLKHLDWKNLSRADKQAIEWTNRLLNQLEESWKQGENPLNVLEKHHWPFIDELKQASESSSNLSMLNVAAQQISSLTGHLPPMHFPAFPTDIEQVTFLSSYFRAYGIDYRSLFPYRGNDQEQFNSLENYWKEHTTNLHLQQKMIFETPLSHRVIPEDIPSKLEDLCPGIVLEVQEGQDKQVIALAHHGAGGLKWPILNGKYVIRFQPQLKELPYRVRLRQARQISYPQSPQVYSYESDVLISEKGKTPVEQTLSMNHVYETWNGYRFYLAGIAASSDANLKRIQLAVNYDPGKYFLTYPGACLIFLGTVLLFWMKSKY